MRWIIVLTAALAAACAAPRVSQPPRLAIADSAWHLEPCKSNAMLQRMYHEPAHTWPVPLTDSRGLLFKILFYPLTWTYGPKAEAYGPVAAAVIDLEADVVVSCAYTATSPKPLAGARPPARPAGRAKRLYELTQTVARDYASGKADRARAEEYARLFDSLAEPALRPYYEEINPGFWRWLKDAAIK